MEAVEVKMNPERELDELLVELLVALPRVPPRVRSRSRELLERAEVHGLAAVVHRALVDACGLDLEIPASFQVRAIARELDHRAHLELLVAIDRIFAAEGIAAVALKGPLFAERYYAVPSGRATSDIDLMVAERDVEHATRALATVGYTQVESPDELRFRRRHHHVHLTSASGPPLELHFHAYRGFGMLLRSEPLVERRQEVHSPELHAIGVLSPEDELVFMAVHAAAHRYMRLGWLYDLGLLVERMSDEQLETAAARARSAGYARVLAFTAVLLHEVLRQPEERMRRLGRLGRGRAAVARRIVREPRSPFARSATRLAYSIALSDTPAAAARYTAGAVADRLRLLRGR